MKRSRFATLRDYLAMAVRRKWWIVGSFLCLSALSVLIGLMIPDSYLSETMILIQPREVPNDFVKDLISGSTEMRLMAIEQTVLSRTNLLKIISQFESSLVQLRGLNDERKVLRLKSQIKVEFPTERLRGAFVPLTHVRISYRDRSPDLAQKIAGRLASLFIEKDIQTRELQVFGTTEFLSAELNKVLTQLQESEARLQGMKERYRYELPSELDTNLRTLDRLQMQKTANLETIDRHLTMQMNLERMISETPETVARETLQRGAPVGGGLLSKVDTYRKKEREYKELLAKATELHPDIQRLKTELERLKQDISTEDFEAVEEGADGRISTAYVSNPVYQNLVSQLNQVKTELAIRERERKLIDTSMALYSRRVQNAPRAEQEIAAVLRINSDLTKQADDLKAKLTQARLAESLESRAKGAQFTILDPANLPLEPAPPTRPVILLLGFVASLILSLCLAFVVDFLNPRVFTAAELERLLAAPVLVEIPTIVTPLSLLRERKLRVWYAFLMVACAGVYAWGLSLLYSRQATLLKYLDPIIEKIRS